MRFNLLSFMYRPINFDSGLAMQSIPSARKDLASMYQANPWPILAPNSPGESMATAEDTNAAAFLQMLPRLLNGHEGQYVLIYGGDKIDCFASEEAAFEAGYSKFELEPFFVGAIKPAAQLAASPRFVSL